MPAGLPPNSELKLAAEDALARLKQAVASTAAAARAAEQKLSGTQALQKAAAGQLCSAQQELASLQEQIAQRMHGIYQLVRYMSAAIIALCSSQSPLLYLGQRLKYVETLGLFSGLLPQGSMQQEFPGGMRHAPLCCFL